MGKLWGGFGRWVGQFDRWVEGVDNLSVVCNYWVVHHAGSADLPYLLR